MWITILIFFTLILFLLPMLPALNEWLNPKDDDPLRVVQEYDGNVRHFANGFRQFLQAHLGAAMAQQPAAHTHNGILQNGTRYQVVGMSEGLKLTEEEERTHTVRQIVICPSSVRLPDHMIFEAEVYGRGDIESGRENYFRALLAEGNIHLSTGCKILRWMHGNAAIAVESACELFGRVSAEGNLRLAEGSRFERLHAPRIEFGPARAPYVPPAGKALTVMEALENVLDHAGNRWLIDGDFEFPSRHFFEGDTVTSGHLLLREGVHIKGSLKSNKSMRLEGFTTIEGSLVSAEDLFIGPNCRIFGPIIAERRLFIHAGVIIGDPDRLTTITAPEIFIDNGVIAHGTVWANVAGFVRRLEGGMA